MKELNLTSGSIVKPMIFMIIPLILQGLIQQLYTTVDILFIGNFAGTLAQAAIGASGIISNMLVNLFTGFSVGAGIVISHCFGSRDDKSLVRAIHTSMSIAAIFGVIISIAGVLQAPIALNIMHTPAEIFDDAVTYIRIYFISTPLMLMFNVSSSITRSCGNTKVPMLFSLAGGVANVLANLLFFAGS